MKRIIVVALMAFCIVFAISARRKKTDGVYSNWYGNTLELKKDSFEYTYSRDPYCMYILGNDRKGTYTWVNSKILRLNNETSTEKLEKDLIIRKHSDNSIPRDSIELHIINADNDDLAKHFYLQVSGRGSERIIEKNLELAKKSVQIVRIPRINGCMNIIISDIYHKITPIYGSWYKEIAPTLIIEKKNVCTVMPEDNVIEFDFRNFLRNTFVYDVIIKDDYVLFDKGNIIYHGEVFSKYRHKRRNAKSGATYTGNVDGLYVTSDSSAWVRLRRDTFECFLSSAEHKANKQGDAYAKGLCKQVNDSLLEFNTLSPEKWARDNIIVRKYYDEHVPSDSIKVRVIVPTNDTLQIYLILYDLISYNNRPYRLCYTDKDTTDLYLSAMPGFLSCELACASAKELLTMKRDFYAFPVRGRLEADTVCTIPSLLSENVVELDFSKTVPHPLLYMFLKGEYVLMEGDTLRWHGKVFRRKEKE